MTDIEQEVTTIANADRERLIDLMIEAKRTEPETGSFTDYLADYLLEHGVIVMEEAEKALDVSEVVRCKNCQNYELMKSGNYHFCNEFGGRVTEKDFCSRGTKTDGGT